MADDEQQETPETKPFTKTEWQIRSEVELELRPKFRVEYETLFGLWKTDELEKVKTEAFEVAQKGFEKLFEKWKEDQKPPDDADIQKLLNQDYAEFNLQIQSSDDDGEVKIEAYTIRELPQSAEKKFYKQFKDKVLTKSQALAAFTQAGVDKPFEEKA